ncbi:peptidase S10 [Duganella sp. FT3S]|uniref:Peptidase S10 n=2 Tax=Rugamonas fusca TaxID=2758568 RepID=A0A7W2I753_9BURK|nr:peptidase S10 [Rugamonas fusca]
MPMPTPPARSRMFTSLILAGLFSLGLQAPAFAADAKPEAKADAKSEIELPPLSEDKKVHQSITLNGKVLHYDATVGAIKVRDAKGKVTAEVVYTSYVVPGADAKRPVTFAFNGGPGAASVYLNLGAIGPKRVQFGDAGNVPSDSSELKDNAATWLDMSDLVFIDPVGTGFSRSLEDADKTKADFYATEPDIKYLSRVVYDWLVKNGRLRSPKFVMGESYGGYRAPRIAYHLQTQLGVGVKGLIMVSPYLDPAAIGDDTALSPLPWMINLPSMAAVQLENQHRLTPAAMQEVESYVRQQYALDLFAGRADPAAIGRLVSKVSGLTGVDAQVVGRLDGRLDIATFLREVHRADKKIGSIYDANVTAWDPFPESADRKSGDPILEALIAPTTSAMVDFITREVGWKTEARYNALSYDVNKAWDRAGTRQDKPVSDLRKAIANDPNMGVLIVHGYNDLACPYFASRLIIDQMPKMGSSPVRLSVYPGGHMFYSRDASAQAFKRDAKALYGL